MQRLVVDSTFQDLLLQSGEHVELCDDRGRTFGYFVLNAEHDRAVYDWARGQISDQELDERRREPGGETTTEILQRLRHA